MSLTPRQQNYILSKCQNNSAEKIARKLGIDKSEVETFLKNPHKEQQAQQVPLFGEGWFYWIVLALAVLLPQLFYSQTMDQSIIRLMALQVAVAGLWLVLLGGRLIINGSFDIPRGWGIVLALILPAWMFCSLTWALNIYEGSMQLANYCAGAGMFVLLCCIKPTLQQLRWGLYALFFGSVWTAVLGLAQSYDFSFLYALQIPQSYPPSATFGNKNMAAHFVAVMLPLGVAALCGLRNKKELVLLPLILGGMFLSIWFLKIASSAGAIMGIMSGVGGCIFILILSWCRRYSRKFKLIIFCAVILIATGIAGAILIPTYSVAKGQSRQLKSSFAQAFFYNLNQRVSAIMGSALNKSSLQIRAKIYANTLCMIADKPLLGVGFGNQRVYYPLYYYKGLPDYEFSQHKQLVNVHNDVLQLIAETGIVGFMLSMVFIICCLGGFLRVVVVTDDWNDKIALYGGAFTVCAYLGISMISFPMQRTAPVIVMAFMLGALYSLGLSASKNKTRTLHLGKILTALTALLAIVITIYTVYDSVRLFKKDYYSNQAILHGNNQRWDLLGPQCQQVLEYAGTERDPLMNCAMAYLFNQRLDKSVELIDRLIRLYPHYANGLGNAGTVYESAGKLDKAAEVLYHAVNILPQDKDLNGSLFRVLRRQNKWTEQSDKVMSAEQIKDSLEKIGQRYTNIKEAQKAEQDIQYYALDLEKERQRIIFRLLVTMEYFHSLSKRDEFNSLLENGIKNNPDWSDLRGIYGLSLLNSGKGETGMQQIAMVYNKLNNDVLSTNCLRSMMLAKDFIRDKALTEKYRAEAGNYLESFLKNAVYDSLGESISELRDVNGILLLTERDAAYWGIPEEYLAFIRNPVELFTKSTLQICSDLSTIPAGKEFYFLSYSAPMIKNAMQYLVKKSGKVVQVDKVASYDSKEIINWPGFVLIAGKRDIRVSLDSEVIEKMRVQGSALGHLSLDDHDYICFAVLDKGKLLFEDSGTDKNINFSLEQNAELKNKISGVQFNLSIPGKDNMSAPVSVQVNGKNYKWEYGLRAFFFNRQGKLVKYRNFIPGDNYKVKQPFQLYKLSYK